MLLWASVCRQSAHMKAKRLVSVYFELCPFAIKFVKSATRYHKAIHFVADRFQK